MENENITPVVEEPAIERPVIPQVPQEPVRKNSLFKIVVIFIGILIAVGLFVNAYLMFSKKETDLKTSDSSVIATPTADSTRGLETYTNKKYGYVIKYPSSWYLYESKEITAGAKNTIGFWPVKGEGEVQGVWIIVRDDRFVFDSLDSWWVQYKKQMLIPIDQYQIEEKKQLESNFDTWINVQKITIDNTSALKVETKQGYPSKPYKSVYLMDNNKEIIEINTNITTADDPNYLVFDQILSTFRFD